MGNKILRNPFLPQYCATQKGNTIKNIYQFKTKDLKGHTVYFEHLKSKKVTVIMVKNICFHNEQIKKTEIDYKLKQLSDKFCSRGLECCILPITQNSQIDKKKVRGIIWKTYAGITTNIIDLIQYESLYDNSLLRYLVRNTQYSNVSMLKNPIFIINQNGKVTNCIDGSHAEVQNTIQSIILEQLGK